MFWSLLILLPETISRNLGQKIGYLFLDKGVANQDSINHKKILVLGDSSAATAIHLSTLGTQAVTLGVWGSSPAETYYYLKRYLENHTTPKCLIFTHLIAPEYYKAHAFWEFVINYSQIPLSFISEIYDESRRLGTFPGNEYNKIAYFTKYFLIKYKFFLVSQDLYRDKIIFTFKSPNVYQKRLNSIFNNNGEYILYKRGLGINGPWWEFLINPFSEDKYFTAYFEKVLKLAEEKNMKIYTFTPPMEKETYLKYRPRIDRLDNYLKSTTEKFKNAEFIDLREFYPQDHYIDNVHLNALGSELFTKKILEKIECN
jgi:hypothetical protein